MSRIPRAQDVARFVGARLRQRRIDLGLSQQGLATLLGVTYQQIHKYETGASRLVSDRLVAISAALMDGFAAAYDGCVAKRTQLGEGKARP